jgi:hypothetical protein
MVPMSPHGSKLWEMIRFLANRLLTDSQRKKIKTFAAKLQRIPLKLMGVEALIESQKTEIERLKSRLTILDGKFNIALYGLPQVKNEYKAYSLESSLLNRYQPPLGLEGWSDQYLARQREKETRAQWKKGMSLIVNSSFKPKTVFISGLDTPELILELLQEFPSLETVFLNDTSSSLMEACQNHLDELQRTASFKIEWIHSDLITPLIALGQTHLDWVISFHRLQRLSPIEQLHFLSLCHELLSEKGCLALILSNLSHPMSTQDIYWSDVRTLRPFSLGMIQNFLEQYSGDLKVIQEAGSHSLELVYRKLGRQ